MVDKASGKTRVTLADAEAARAEILAIRDVAIESADDEADAMGVQGDIFDTLDAALEGRTDLERQLTFMQTFFEQPGILSLREMPIVSTTTSADLAGRRKTLKYQIDLVDALGKLLRTEMAFLDNVKLLEQAETEASEDGNQS